MEVNHSARFALITKMIQPSALSMPLPLSPFYSLPLGGIIWYVCVYVCHMAIISAWPARTANELNQKSICRRGRKVRGGVVGGRWLRIKWNLWDKILKKERNLCNFPYERELLIAPGQAEFVISSSLFLLLS